MKNLATGIMLLALGLLWVPRADAQVTDVTIRQINALHPDSLVLLQAGGAAMTEDEITRRVATNEFVSAGDTVRFGAVVLSNPRNSGLATPDDETGLPGRIHIYVRDTTSVTDGNDGMGIQMVDNNYQLYGTDGLFPGDVIEIVGVVAVFSGEIQISPVSAPNVIGTYQDLGFPDTIMDPVVVTTADVNMSVGPNGEIQPNWANYASLRGQYIRFESVTVAERDISGARPGWYLTSDGGVTGALIRDVSLRYRNDRDQQSDEYNVRDDDFVPPPPGSVVNLQGFLTLYDFDQFGHNTPMGLYIAPFEDSDLEVVASPPIITNVVDPDLPDANPVAVTADVSADPTRTLATVELHYFTSTAPDTVTVAAGAPTGTNYPFEIPAVADGDFVTYWISATDNIGASSRSTDQIYRVLADGIDEIADIQTTVSGGPGNSPFAGATVAMNIAAVVQTDGAATGIWALQDDGDAPWSGIEVFSFKSSSPIPALGDNVTVTEARVVENFSLTRLDSVVVTIDGAGTPYPHKIMTTDALQDPAIAEAHEGMLVRFEDVIIANANEGFGEWSFHSASTTAENFVKADDFSTAIADTFAVITFEDGSTVTYIQGLLSYTFNEYKVFPGTASDIGDVGTSIEEDVLAGGYGLAQNYPNPFARQTAITLTTPEAGPVRLAVYDVLGRHVSTLIDGVLPAGDHTVEFDRSGLASGLYLYRLQAGSTSMVRSMTIVR